MNDEEMLEHAEWLLTQKVSGAARDFLEDLIRVGFEEPESNSRQHRRLRELILFYPR